MQRRHLLQLAGCSALAACAPRWPGPSRGVRAVAFDLFTLFDPRTVDRRVSTVITGDPAAFATTWKTRLFEYCWIRASAGHYAAFDRLVVDSLAYAATAHRITLSGTESRHLASAFTELDPWPDASGALRELRTRGLRLAPLANFSPAMIQSLLARANLQGLFDLQISTDEARTYKPDPRAYAFAERRFDLGRGEIAFAAFGGWDASGGSWFGFPTFWVNRLAASPEELAAPTASGPDLAHLLDWLAGGATPPARPAALG